MPAQLRIDHKAHEGLADKDIAALFGLRLHELADLARKLGVEQGEHGIVVGGDKDGIECRRRVDAVDHQSLILHVASGLLGKLLKGEQGTGGTEDAGHVVLEDVQEVHERSLSVWVLWYPSKYRHIPTIIEDRIPATAALAMTAAARLAISIWCARQDAAAQPMPVTAMAAIAARFEP